MRSRTLCLLGYQYLKDPSSLRPPALVVRSRTLRLLGYQTSTLDISQLLVLVLVAGISISISFFFVAIRGEERLLLTIKGALLKAIR